MKKLSLLLLVLVLGFLSSCDLINQVTSSATKVAVDKMTEAAGIENFDLPEAENYRPNFSYNEENDETLLQVTAVNAEGDFEAFKTKIDECIDDAFGNNDPEYEDPGIVKKEIEGGYSWYCETTTGDEENPQVITFEITFIQSESDWVVSFSLSGAGNILSSLTKELNDAAVGNE